MDDVIDLDARGIKYEAHDKLIRLDEGEHHKLPIELKGREIHWRAKGGRRRGGQCRYYAIMGRRIGMDHGIITIK